MPTLSRYLVGLVFSLLAACASWKPIAYSADPLHASDPEDLKRLALMAKVWRPTTVEVHPSFALLMYTGPQIPGGVVSVTVPFSDIAKIALGMVGDDLVVRATDAKGVNVYEYVAVDRRAAEQMVDVLSAFVRANRPEALEPRVEI